MADAYEEKCLGEISAFLDQSAREMEAVLHKLGWEKEKILEAVRILVIKVTVVFLYNWINHYPVDNSIDFANIYPLDSDLSGG